MSVNFSCTKNGPAWSRHDRSKGSLRHHGSIPSVKRILDPRHYQNHHPMCTGVSQLRSHTNTSVLVQRVRIYDNNFIPVASDHVSHRPQLSFKAQFSQRVSFFSNTAVEASPPLSRMYCSEIRRSFRLSTDWCALNECSREIHIIICIYAMI